MWKRRERENIFSDEIFIFFWRIFSWLITIFMMKFEQNQQWWTLPMAVFIFSSYTHTLNSTETFLLSLFTLVDLMRKCVKKRETLIKKNFGCEWMDVSSCTLETPHAKILFHAFCAFTCNAAMDIKVNSIIAVTITHLIMPSKITIMNP